MFRVTEPYTCTSIDERALQAWEQDGILKIEGLIAPDWFTYLRTQIIAVMGAAPESAEAWTHFETSRLKPIGRDTRCAPLEINSVKEVIDRLIGKEWGYPRTGGVWFADTARQVERQHAPPLALAPRGHWHWDDRPDLHPSEALWLFTPVIEMPPHSGGTWLVAGSARMVRDFYARLSPEQRGKPTRVVKKWFANAHAWVAMLNGGEAFDQEDQDSEPVRLCNVSGRPGDAVLMKNFTIHSSPEYIGPGPRLCQVGVASSVVS